MKSSTVALAGGLIINPWYKKILQRIDIISKLTEIANNKYSYKKCYES